jgi:hypothetical protein
VLDMKKASPGQGGGIYAAHGMNLNLHNVTIAKNAVEEIPPGGNALPSQGGGVYVTADVNFKAVNTLIATNSASQGTDVVGPFAYADHNLIGVMDQYASFQKFTLNFIGTPNSPLDPMLMPLAFNLGPTNTCALAKGSPAIDNGDTSAAAGKTDQRGLPRVYGPNVDIGAYEAQPITEPAPPPTSPGSPRPSPMLFPDLLTELVGNEGLRNGAGTAADQGSMVGSLGVG